MAENQSNNFQTVACVNCNSIQQNSYILECFHVICDKCIPDFENSSDRCCRVPLDIDSLTPHPLTHIYSQQLQCLLEARLRGNNINKCVICQNEQPEERDILYCVKCASFWCEPHQEIHHRAMINGNQHPFIKLNTNLEMREIMTEVSEDRMDRKEREGSDQLNQYITNCEDLLSESEEHQNKLNDLCLTVEKWRGTVNKDIDSRFKKIRDLLDALEIEAKQNVESICQETTTQLEACHLVNEKKISTKKRAIEMMQNIKCFCPRKGKDALKVLTFNKLKEATTTSFVTFLLEMTPRIIKVSRELEKETNKISVAARVIDPNHTSINFNLDKQLYEGQELEICIHTCDQHDVDAFSTNTILLIEIDKKNVRGGSMEYLRIIIGKEKYSAEFSGYFYQIEVLEAGRYELRLKVNNQKINKKWDFSVSRDISCIRTPTKKHLQAKGEVNGIASQGSYLYVVAGSQGEVGIYLIIKGVYSRSRSSSGVSTSLEHEQSQRFFTPRFEIPSRLTNSTPGMHESQNDKFDINFEGSIGKGVLSGPYGICCYEDFIYVSDRVVHAVFCFTNIGNLIQKFGKHGRGIGEFTGPHGLSINKTRNQLAVADRFNHRIQLVDLKSGSMVAVGYSEHYVLEQPVDVAITNEDFYVISTSKNDILFYDNNFQWIKCLLTEIQDPWYITIDQTNQLYISSYSLHKIYTILPLPENVYNIREVDIGEGINPTGIAVGSDGAIYAICHNNTKGSPAKPMIYGW